MFIARTAKHKRPLSAESLVGNSVLFYTMSHLQGTGGVRKILSPAMLCIFTLFATHPIFDRYMSLEERTIDYHTEGRTRARRTAITGGVGGRNRQEWLEMRGEWKQA